MYCENYLFLRLPFKLNCIGYISFRKIWWIPQENTIKHNWIKSYILRLLYNCLYCNMQRRDTVQCMILTFFHWQNKQFTLIYVSTYIVNYLYSYNFKKMSMQISAVNKEYTWCPNSESCCHFEDSWKQDSWSPTVQRLSAPLTREEGQTLPPLSARERSPNFSRIPLPTLNGCEKCAFPNLASLLLYPTYLTRRRSRKLDTTSFSGPLSATIANRRPGFASPLSE